MQIFSLNLLQTHLSPACLQPDNVGVIMRCCKMDEGRLEEAGREGRGEEEVATNWLSGNERCWVERNLNNSRPAKIFGSSRMK